MCKIIEKQVHMVMYTPCGNNISRAPIAKGTKERCHKKREVCSETE